MEIVHKSGKFPRSGYLSCSHWTHTNFTHIFTLTKQNKPLCEFCGYEITVNNVLYSCRTPKTLTENVNEFFNERLPLHSTLPLGESVVVGLPYVCPFGKGANVLNKIYVQ